LEVAAAFDSFDTTLRRGATNLHRKQKATLAVSYVEGRRHLPVIELRRAA
jgi:hypothetical protein